MQFQGTKSSRYLVVSVNARVSTMYRETIHSLATDVIVFRGCYSLDKPEGQTTCAGTTAPSHKQFPSLTFGSTPD